MRALSLVVFLVAVVVLPWIAVQAQVSLPGHVVAVERISPILAQPDATYHLARAVRPPVLDGKADEWQGIPAIVLDRQEQTGNAWTGPADASGKLRLQWDSEQLYFCLEVIDDVHAAPNGEKDFWANDGVQFAFDAYMNGPRGSYDIDEQCYVLCDTPRGPLAASYRRRGQTADIETVMPEVRVAMAVRPDGARVYEWGMSWSQLAPVSPSLLGSCGFTFTLNDNDGNGFKNAIYWTPGISWGQDASRFGRLIFAGAVGTFDAMLPIRPDTRIFPDDPRSRWLDIPGMAGNGTARLLACSAKGGRIDARVEVYRAGKPAVVASGALAHEAAAGRLLAFTWDLDALPSGEYEVVFRAPALPEQRFPYLHFNRAQAGVRKAELVERFGLDRRWDDMADASPFIHRHRGLAALAIQCFESDDWLRGIETFMTPQQTVEVLAALMAGKDYLGTRRDSFFAAYYSPADGSGQPFVVSLPARYSPAKTYPLIVSLHGNTGRPRPPSTKTTQESYILLQPWGRGDNSYNALGEDDVLRAIAYMRQWYRIDPLRIYVTGGSMGGSGTWGMATRHPDLFAAAAPVFGAADGFALENLRHVPVFNQHGQVDWRMPIDLSRYGISSLQQKGYTVLHKEYPTLAHAWIPDLYAKDPWLLQFRRPASPDTITYTCETAARGRAYWLQIRQFVEPHQRARVQAGAAGGGADQALTLLLDNVAVLECDVARMPLTRKGALRVLVNGEYREVAAPLPERLFLFQQDGQWTIADHWTPPVTIARAYRAGAAANLYGGEALLIVYGTQGSRADIYRNAAEALAGYAGAGGTPMAVGRIPVKADRDVTAEEIARCHLILLGGAGDNLVTARMAGQLPFTINDKNELLAGGREPVSLNEAGLCLAYFNPLAPDRLIYLVATEMDAEKARAWFANSRRLLVGSGGWTRVDQPDLLVRAHDGAVRRLMQFTDGWQWRQVEGADIRLSEAMATANALNAASMRVMRRLSRADFVFEWGDRSNARVYDPRWVTLADMATAATPRQLLLGCMTGEEVRDFYAKSVARGDALALPAALPTNLDPQRLYRVAMPPSIIWLTMQHKRNLRDVQAAPDWRAEDFWDEVFSR